MGDDYSICNDWDWGSPGEPCASAHCYEGAPASMRSMLQAFNLFAMGGMPNAVSSGLSLITQQYTPNNLNDGNLPMVYYINAIFAALGCGLTIGSARPGK